MHTPYRALAVANYFLLLARKSGDVITPMKMQKLLFFSQGWHLAIFDGKPLFSEPIRAWRYGPVVSTIYNAFKRYGNRGIDKQGQIMEVPISGPAQLIETELITYQEAVELGSEIFQPPIVEEDDKKTTAFLARIWEIYGKYSALTLANMTHAEGTPWRNVVDLNSDNLNIWGNPEIGHEALRAFFISQRKGAHA